MKTSSSNNLTLGRQLAEKNGRYDLFADDMQYLYNLAKGNGLNRDFVFDLIANSYYYGLAKGYKLAKNRAKQQLKNRR